ncbi:MAG: hypothetical protein AMS24_01665 [Chlamydiae bacterium SM23_39]|nr:MAG: hypothetical protein AMS24_01665 [Chlamydiae bacterium SM23_39]
MIFRKILLHLKKIFHIVFTFLKSIMETKPPSEKSACYNDLKHNEEKIDTLSLKVEKKINELALNKMTLNQAVIFGHLVQAITNKNADLPFKYKLKKRKKKKKKKKF